MLLDAGRIRTLRMARGWTQEQLAELSDLSVRTIQRIEKDGVASLETCNAVAAVLETDREALLADGGVTPARTEFRLAHVVAVAAASLIIGIGIGALV